MPLWTFALNLFSLICIPFNSFILITFIAMENFEYNDAIVSKNYVNRNKFSFKSDLFCKHVYVYLYGNPKSTFYFRYERLSRLNSLPNTYLKFAWKTTGKPTSFDVLNSSRSSVTFPLLYLNLQTYLLFWFDMTRSLMKASVLITSQVWLL